MSELREKGYMLIALSGSNSELVEEFAKIHDFDDWSGSVWHRSADEKRYLGTVHKNAKDKRAGVEEFVKRHSLTYTDSYAIGDTQSDASMLAAVDNPIAFNPEPQLFKTAQENKWKIVV